MAPRTLLLTLAGVLTLGLSGCGKDANTKICLDDFKKFEDAVKAEDNAARQLAGGVYQSCGISCDITKDEDACGAFKKVTEVLCEKEGKEECERLCNEGRGNSEKPEKNEHACAALAKM